MKIAQTRDVPSQSSRSLKDHIISNKTDESQILSVINFNMFGFFYLTDKNDNTFNHSVNVLLACCQHSPDFNSTQQPFTNIVHPHKRIH